MLPIILGVIVVSATLIHWIPGDPADAILGEQATEQERQTLRTALGLDQSVPKYIASVVFKVLRGDLGSSLFNQQPVITLLRERMSATGALALASLALAILLGIPLGVISATSQGIFGWMIRGYSVLGLSVPGVFLGPMLIWIFAVVLGVLPVSGRESALSLILPAISLAIPLSAVLVRITRASVLQVLREDYIRVAHSKGLAPVAVFGRHALANALIPVITVVGLQTGAMLTGTVVTETIFDWPGLGSLLLQSIQRRDYPTFQACLMVVSVIYLLANLCTDILYGFANPALRVNK